ncbi:hypothetical protein ACHAWO_011390 [Cyclotella atomus]|uniref:Endoplasmic reticulum transmembrane protein n=1 Tax=Cyclotella atomus TaxID=382360 RepID=A0ABD3P702_9STRA
MSKRTTNRDEESLLQTLDAAPPTNATSASAPSVLGGGSSSGPGGNPILLAKMVLRKVLTIVTSDNDESAVVGGDGYGPITLLKDVFIGTIFGLVTISMLIFMDHLNIIHLQSAHNFRESAFAMLNDPETLANLEESTGLKFIPVSEYESIQSEINEASEKLAKIQSTIQERVKEGEEKKAELGPLKEEYEKLLANSNLGLENWNGDAKWGGGGSCDARKQYFIDTYGHSEVTAKVAIMKQTPNCKKD